MRLADINDFVDAKRVYERAYRRAFQKDRDATVYVDTITQIRELATLTDTPLKRTAMPEAGTYWTVIYRGVTFQFFSSDAYEGEDE